MDSQVFEGALWPPGSTFDFYTFRPTINFNMINWPNDALPKSMPSAGQLCEKTHFEALTFNLFEDNVTKQSTSTKMSSTVHALNHYKPSKAHFDCILFMFFGSI